MASCRGPDHPASPAATPGEAGDDPTKRRTALALGGAVLAPRMTPGAANAYAHHATLTTAPSPAPSGPRHDWRSPNLTWRRRTRRSASRTRPSPQPAKPSPAAASSTRSAVAPSNSTAPCNGATPRTPPSPSSGRNCTFSSRPETSGSPSGYHVRAYGDGVHACGPRCRQPLLRGLDHVPALRRHPKPLRRLQGQVRSRLPRSASADALSPPRPEARHAALTRWLSV